MIRYVLCDYIASPHECLDLKYMIWFDFNVY
ncbi:hypothetical protein SMB34_06400 [Thalassospira permensis NBRC 106175]|uniref:Uncharacterized protein n=1 Tax=Thalassospira permensis NBRC 106175 TaxID=1353532 RepID=A0ABR4TKK3_9PROT|nr:hypothetical protein SMB34_06400 [Thalassospira permensis NBRC 106175]